MEKYKKRIRINISSHADSNLSNELDLSNIQFFEKYSKWYFYHIKRHFIEVIFYLSKRKSYGCNCL